MKPRTLVILMIALLALHVAAPGAMARQAPRAAAVSVEARINPSVVFVGDTARLTITIEGSSTPEQPAPPTIPGAAVEYLGSQNLSSHSTIIVNGVRREESRLGFAFTFGITPAAVGTYSIPSLTVTIDGKPYATRPLTLEARAAEENRDVRFSIEVDNPAPYVGEPITLTLTFGVRNSAQDLRFSFPGVGEQPDAAFNTAAYPGDYTRGRQWFAASLFDRETPAVQGRATFDGRPFDTYTLKAMLIPRRAGRQTLGPGVMSITLLIPTGDFFNPSRPRRVAVPSNTIELDVKPLPAEGRPANFSGLIGRYAIQAEASPSEAGVGDPITLTIAVTGPLVEAVRAPAIERQADLASRFRIAADEAAPQVAGDRKVFTRTLRALTDDVTEIPAIELPYFDTASGTYQVARSAPIPIRVRAVRIVTAGDAVGGAGGAGGVGGGANGAAEGSAIETSTTGIAANDVSPEALVHQGFDLIAAIRSPAGSAALLAPPAAYAAALVVIALRRRALSNPEAKRRRAALSTARRALADAADAANPADAVSRAITGYLADKTGAPPGSITPADAEALLRARDDDLSIRARAILERCDAARFGGLALADAEALRADAARLLDALDPVLGRRA